MPEVTNLLRSYEYSILFPGLYWDAINVSMANDILKWTDGAISIRDLYKMGGRKVAATWQAVKEEAGH